MNENCGRDVLRSDAAKWLRLIVSLESNEDSINAKPEGKTKISFQILLPRSLVDIAWRILKAAKFLSETEAKQLRPKLHQPDRPETPPDSWQDR
jgi:hypothetical protein